MSNAISVNANIFFFHFVILVMALVLTESADADLSGESNSNFHVNRNISMQQPIQTPITGSETINDLKHPVDALAEFYKAFNEGDFDLMEKNWLNTPDTTMSNPLGGVKRGWEDIRSVYKNIFNGSAKVYVEYYDYTIFQGDGFFQAVGRERGKFTLGDKSIELRIRTSRSFVLHDGRYHQLHHHGSIEEPKLLAIYQNAVLKGVIE